MCSLYLCGLFACPLPLCCNIGSESIRLSMTKHMMSFYPSFDKWLSSDNGVVRSVSGEDNGAVVCLNTSFMNGSVNRHNPVQCYGPAHLYIF